MSDLDELETLLTRRNCPVVIAADGETRTVENRDGRPVEVVPAGGVAVAMDRVSQAIGATYIGRARNRQELELVGDDDNKVTVGGRLGTYRLKRVEVTPAQMDTYYYGYANQTLWPLFHIAFERPIFNSSWYAGYREVNEKFAAAIQAEITGDTLVWVNDYQLALVPSFLDTDNITLAYFWHIPWPGWDRFRLLPQRDEILRSLLACDFIGFHTAEYARNFLLAAREGAGARIDEHNLTARIDRRTVRCAALPIGVDPEAVRNAARDASSEPLESAPLERLFKRYSVILGADRLDYSKGIRERLLALDSFFATYPEYRERVVYLGIMSPTREKVPAYRRTREEVVALANEINAKYATRGWKPLHMRYQGLPRDQIARLYARAAVCLVTSLADGMNLVAKEFVVGASSSPSPGVLVLSEFTGAHAELPDALSINPLNPEEVAAAIVTALQMPLAARQTAIKRMASHLESVNIYAWALEFIRGTLGPPAPHARAG